MLDEVCHSEGGAASGGPVLTLDLLVVQPTPFCNINCSYCYLPDRHLKKTMSKATLDRLFARVFGSGLGDRGFTVVWHAGEPLVLPPEWYTRALAIIERHNQGSVRVEHSIQTNGLLLDDRWVEFTRTRNIQIGLSIDEPQPLHDAHRRTRGGRNLRPAMEAVRRLQACGVDFHVITVLTELSLDRAEELFDFYVTSGIRRVGLNIEEIEAANVRSSLDRPDIGPRFKGFLSRFLELMEAHPEAIELRELAGAVAAITNPSGRRIDNPQVQPLRIVSVSVDGYLSTFSPELLGVCHEQFGDFVFGNILDGGIADMLNVPNFRLVHARIAAGVERCRRECAYFSVCGGGAPANKLFENGGFDTTETLYCRLTKQAVIDVVLDRMERRLGLQPATTARDEALRGEMG